MTSATVRLALAEDVPTLVDLMTEFYAESNYTLPWESAARTFTDLLSDKRLGRIWLIECETEPAGYVVLTLGFSMEYGGLRGFVDDLFVRERFRGRGLATAALGEVGRTCTTLGVRALLVEVGPDNDRAQRVYRRSGFEDSGRLLMTMPLASPVHVAGIA